MPAGRARPSASPSLADAAVEPAPRRPRPVPDRRGRVGGPASFPPGVAGQARPLRLPAGRPPDRPPVLRRPGAGRPLLPPCRGGPPGRAGAVGRRTAREVRRARPDPRGRVRRAPVRIEILRHGLTRRRGRPGRGRPSTTPWASARRPDLGSQRAAGRRARCRAGQSGPRSSASHPVGPAAGRAPTGPTPPTSAARHGWRIGRRWVDTASPRSPRWAVAGGRRPGRRRLPDRRVGAVAGRRRAVPAPPSGWSFVGAARRRARGGATSGAAWPPTWAPAARQPGDLRLVRAALGQHGPVAGTGRLAGVGSNPCGGSGSLTVHGSHDDPTARGPRRAPGAGPQRRARPGRWRSTTPRAR